MGVGRFVLQLVVGGIGGELDEKFVQLSARHASAEAELRSVRELEATLHTTVSEVAALRERGLLQAEVSKDVESRLQHVRTHCAVAVAVAVACMRSLDRLRFGCSSLLASSALVVALQCV
jgi:hypothetical protein